MPEKNDMEILMQQKMEEFRIEPPPTDWQVIYNRLHPKKYRRFLWLLLPLVAGLAWGSYWLASQNQSLTSNATTTLTVLPAQEPAGNPNPGITKVQATQTKDQLNTTNESSSADIEKSTTPITSSISLQTKDEQRNYPVVAEKARKTFSKKPTQPVDDFASNQSSNFIQQTDTDNLAPSKLTQAEESLSGNKAASETENEIAAVPINHTTTIENKLIQEEIKVPPFSNTKPLTDSQTTQPSSLEPTKIKKSIPNLSSHADKGWYLGGYAEVGANNPLKPFSIMKFASSSSIPNSSGLTTTSESTDNGFHYALGLSLERKLKKMSLSFGIGVQSNSWSSSSVTYKDSLVGGGLFSRTQISNNNINYAHLALELPVMLNFRFTGKKQSSFWLTTGLNNAITVKLDQKTDVTIIQGSTSYSQDISLTSRTRSYQPQFRIGFMYENTRDRHHWQMAPFLQFGLNSMVKTGNPDIQMLHLGLQARYYFKRLR